MSNVIVFMSDEHNPRYASPYGHPFVDTPNMQRLADNGTVFEYAYCPSPLCVPSRSAFLTGKRAHAVQAYGNTRNGIPPETNGLGALLAEHGVHTAFGGKVHAYRPVDELGFSETLAANDEGFVFDPAQERTPLAVRDGSAQRLSQYGPRDEPWGRDVEYMDAAVAWLTERAPAIDAPWVLYVNLVKPHFPHYCTPALWDLYRDHGDLPEHGVEAETARHPYAVDLRTHFELHDVPEEHVRGLRRGYYACITFIDQQLGRLLSALDTSGLADTTNLIYTSDHGEMLGKFGLWWKCNLLEDAARIPCIAAGPDFPAGQRVATPVDLHDVQASVFSATGAAHPAGWNGVPLGSISPNDTERAVFSEYHGHGTRAGSFMVRRGNWKLIHNIAAPDQLFDLATDPEELDNRLATNPRIAAELSGLLTHICDPVAVQQQAEAFWQMQVAQYGTR
ncbi:MAG: sulfatase-like hydrolase/transferase [Gammaproteobacteria bacterium]|nr:sulfatase-like hydrolase/transferase [Gammaproteobacteria bacterium]